jgi:hypothetical protein
VLVDNHKIKKAVIFAVNLRITANGGFAPINGESHPLIHTGRVYDKIPTIAKPIK